MNYIRIPKTFKAPVRSTPAEKDYIRADEWASLSRAAQNAALKTQATKGFSRRHGEKEYLAAYAWNPVTGCSRGCDYCTAREVANRTFGAMKFKPTLYPLRLNVPLLRVRPEALNNRVMVSEMGDLFGEDVPGEWVRAVLKACKNCPSFNFVFLTQNPRRLLEFRFSKRNSWVGVTATTQAQLDEAEAVLANVKARVKWVNIEPMLEPVMPEDGSVIDWYVVGGRAATRTVEAFLPESSWVDSLVAEVRALDRSIFVKNNIVASERPKKYPVLFDDFF